MFDRQLLKTAMMLRDISQVKAAAFIGLSAKTFSLKMNSKIDWRLGEVQKLCQLLNIDDPRKIFFPEKG